MNRLDSSAVTFGDLIRGVLLMGVIVLGIHSCQALSTPVAPPPGSTETPTRIDAPVTVPIGETGGAVVVTAPGTEPRPVTVADPAIDAIAGVAGALGGNPMLVGVASSVLHLLVGLFRRKPKA